MRTLHILALASLLLPAASAFVPSDAPTFAVESPQAAAAHRLCSVTTDTCVRTDATATLKGCSTEANGETCVVHYLLAVETDSKGAGGSCGWATMQPTGDVLNCALAPASVTVPRWSEGVKTYRDLPAGATIREPVRMCVDYSTPSETCEDFTVILRLPGQGVLLANVTATTPIRGAHGSAALCTQPGEESDGRGCAMLHVRAGVGCTGEGASRECVVVYRITAATNGVALCAEGSFAGARLLSCSHAGPDVKTAGVVRFYVGGGATIHEEGTFCINADAAGERCVAFGLDVPLS